MIKQIKEKSFVINDMKLSIHDSTNQVSLYAILNMIINDREQCNKYGFQVMLSIYSNENRKVYMKNELILNDG